MDGHSGIYTLSDMHSDLKQLILVVFGGCNTTIMKTQVSKRMIIVPNSPASLLFDRSKGRRLPGCDSNEPFNIAKGKEISRINRKIKLGFNVESFTRGILEHVRLAPKITETVKGKLRLGARILQVGGVEKVFKKTFSFENGEKLLKVSQCYLSTTAGPIAGLVFISTEKVAFCSERSIKVVSPSRKILRFYYKVSIPLRKIERASASENVKKPSQKYIELVTDDNFEFWFMGFLNHQKTLKYIQQVLHEAQ